ncbi:hypothetical protein SARC_03195 [Sphaeroforma arctica JP610]|uniref:Uncharacterized protein n=1 Tax=Sphaeroforma arctica JP610 TaxID=667725 RepID=A0A0L0G8P8_9EUKA|nr:hypothetical protein SARC_03195 [Sphaeroforma arctica JP610]KNC84598.1 hypothetical protein SARC_03195 [Sphaeroforma arctica JP610]|eukprot:XP_014158500.1 hypothetical protein SARC_03195 [Sphaeroforma arctica JP610]
MENAMRKTRVHDIEWDGFRHVQLSEQSGSLAELIEELALPEGLQPRIDSGKMTLHHHQSPVPAVWKPIVSSKGAVVKDKEIVGEKANAISSTPDMFQHGVATLHEISSETMLNIVQPRWARKPLQKPKVTFAAVVRKVLIQLYVQGVDDTSKRVSSEAALQILRQNVITYDWYQPNKTELTELLRVNGIGLEGMLPKPTSTAIPSSTTASTATPSSTTTTTTNMSSPPGPIPNIIGQRPDETQSSDNHGPHEEKIMYWQSQQDRLTDAEVGDVVRVEADRPYVGNPVPNVDDAAEVEEVEEYEYQVGDGQHSYTSEECDNCYDWDGEENPFDTRN